MANLIYVFGQGKRDKPFIADQSTTNKSPPLYRAATFNDKTRINPSENFGHAWKLDKLAIEPDQPISKVRHHCTHWNFLTKTVSHNYQFLIQDWRYYKKLYTDPEFDVRNYPPWLNEAARKAKVLEDEKAQGKTANGNEE